MSMTGKEKKRLAVAACLLAAICAWQAAIPATPYGPSAMKSDQQQEAAHE